MAHSNPKISVNFPESYTRYKIWVKAFTFKNEGLSSDPIEVLTDVSGPGLPLFRNVSCLNDNALSLEWAMPIKYDRSVDYFVVQYRKSATESGKLTKWNTSTRQITFGYRSRQ